MYGFGVLLIKKFNMHFHDSFLAKSKEIKLPTIEKLNKNRDNYSNWMSILDCVRLKDTTRHIESPNRVDKIIINQRINKHQWLS